MQFICQFGNKLSDYDGHLLLAHVILGPLLCPLGQLVGTFTTWNKLIHTTVLCSALFLHYSAILQQLAKYILRRVSVTRTRTIVWNNDIQQWSVSRMWSVCTVYVRLLVKVELFRVQPMHNLTFGASSDGEYLPIVKPLRVCTSHECDQ